MLEHPYLRPAVRALAVTSVADLPLMPDGWRLPVERNACPIREGHPTLPAAPAFYHELNPVPGRPDGAGLSPVA